MRSKLLLLVCGSLCTLLPRIGFTAATARGSLDSINLQIVPLAGMLTLGGPWSAETFVQAQNSLGEFDSQSDLSGGGTAMSLASVTFASADGQANAGTRNASDASDVNIPGLIDAQASSVGRGSLTNTFTITGGVGTVDVDFSLLLNGMLDVFTDQFGEQAEAEVILNLLLDGDSILFHQSILTVGPSSTDTLPVSENFSATRTLQYDASYFVLLEVDSESAVVNVPEPSAALLAFLSAGFLATLRKKRTT